MRKACIVSGMLALAIAGLVVGCGRSEEPRDPQAVAIKSYDVPEGYDSTTVFHMFVDVLGRNDPVGSASRGPNDTIIVTAPESVQQGIHDLVARLAARGPQPVEPAPESVTLDYWFLLGRPQPGDGLKVVSAALQHNVDLRPVMEQIVKSQGGMEFHLLEQMQLTSTDGERGRVRGRTVEVEQRMLKHESGQRLADIKLTIFGAQGVRHTMETRIKLESGRFIVLGQTAYDRHGQQLPGLDKDADDLMLYYVISSRID